MKSSIIFSACLILLISGCASTDNHSRADDDSLFISSSYQHWFAMAPGESDFTERGIDLQLELHQNSKIYRPVHIIFNGRESFPADVSRQDGEEDKLVIKARVLLQSSLFAEKSQQTNVSDRLVFRDEDGELHHVEINNWERLPDRYN